MNGFGLSRHIFVSFFAKWVHNVSSHITILSKKINISHPYQRFDILTKVGFIFPTQLLLYFKRCHITFELLYVTASSSVFYTPHCVHLCSYSDSRCLFCWQGVSVEAVDPVFQAKMLDMLKQTGRWEDEWRWKSNYCFEMNILIMSDDEGLWSLCCRPEMVVGWYHSHPGFGCWLSGVDINTQQSFEALSERAVAVVVDPIQSVKGKVTVHEHTQQLF